MATAVTSPVLTVMIQAVRKAARGLVRDFGELEHLQVSVKGISDFVSSADRKAEDILVIELRKARPSFGFTCEEGGEELGSENARWIIDPLDGTTNFLHGLPHFAISLGLEKEGELVAGVIYQPISDELFWAGKGEGAYLNGRRLRVASRKKLEDSIITTGIPHRGRGDHPHFLKQCEKVMAACAGVRRLGSAALDLAYVAAGRVDGYWEEALSPWDIAAGILIVKEAGGYVCDINGGQDMLHNGSIVASNSYLIQPLRDML